MDWRLLMLVVGIGGVSVSPPLPTAHLQVPVEKPATVTSKQQLQQLAKSITVKVLSKGFLGSGILIEREDGVYTVLTNAHVLRSGESPYQIETPDGQVHSAWVERRSIAALKGNDLALLQFRTSKTYKIASLGSASALKAGGEVFAAGFPFESDTNRDRGFVFRQGQVTLVLDKALEGGYRIGYTNDIEKGMSGGPLVNLAGEVVAINGMHAEPLWGEPYVYQDGVEPSAPQKKQFSQYSWGIPVDTFEQLVPRSFRQKASEVK
ncbi:MAG: serine protease [Cyanosarcina radialis HA8281-LM2]|jgi:S1-C subfamily serine protease|nr:serine protease [Cyanosarcina radialis HA8281-LM2]